MASLSSSSDAPAALSGSQSSSEQRPSCRHVTRCLLQPLGYAALSARHDCSSPAGDNASLALSRRTIRTLPFSLCSAPAAEPAAASSALAAAARVAVAAQRAPPWWFLSPSVSRQTPSPACPRLGTHLRRCAPAVYVTKRHAHCLPAEKHAALAHTEAWAAPSHVSQSCNIGSIICCRSVS